MIATAITYLNYLAKSLQALAERLRQATIARYFRQKHKLEAQHLRATDARHAAVALAKKERDKAIREAEKTCDDCINDHYEIERATQQRLRTKQERARIKIGRVTAA